MSYQLGIDIGTTFTAAAVHDDGAADAFPLSERRVDAPTMIASAGDGTFVVGWAAAAKLRDNPDAVVHSFKRRIGEPTPLKLGDHEHEPHWFIGQIIRLVVETVVNTQGGLPSRVVLTHPACWNAHKISRLLQAGSVAGLNPETTTLLSEPEAAAIAHASREQVPDGSVLAVYDLGGGSYDTALLRRSGSTYDILGVPEGIERLGGLDFDAALYRYSLDQFCERFSDLDPEDPATADARAKLLLDSVEVKERLSFESSAELTMKVGNRSQTITVQRSSFESLIRPTLMETIGAVRRVLRSARITAEKVDRVLLAGSSSRIPLVAQLLSEELDRPIAVDDNPKELVAIGAALVAASPDAGTVPADAVSWVSPTASTATPSSTSWPPPTVAKTSSKPAPKPKRTPTPPSVLPPNPATAVTSTTIAADAPPSAPPTKPVRTSTTPPSVLPPITAPAAAERPTETPPPIANGTQAATPVRPTPAEPAQAETANGEVAHGEASQPEPAQGDAANGETAQGESAPAAKAQGETADGETAHGEPGPVEPAQDETASGGTAEGETARADAAEDEIVDAPPLNRTIATPPSILPPNPAMGSGPLPPKPAPEPAPSRLWSIDQSPAALFAEATAVLPASDPAGPESGSPEPEDGAPPASESTSDDHQDQETQGAGLGNEANGSADTVSPDSPPNGHATIGDSSNGAWALDVDRAETSQDGGPASGTNGHTDEPLLPDDPDDLEALGPIVDPLGDDAVDSPAVGQQEQGGETLTSVWPAPHVPSVTPRMPDSPQPDEAPQAEAPSNETSPGDAPSADALPPADRSTTNTDARRWVFIAVAVCLAVLILGLALVGASLGSDEQRSAGASLQAAPAGWPTTLTLAAPNAIGAELEQSATVRILEAELGLEIDVRPSANLQTVADDLVVGAAALAVLDPFSYARAGGSDAGLFPAAVYAADADDPGYLLTFGVTAADRDDTAGLASFVPGVVCVADRTSLDGFHLPAVGLEAIGIDASKPPSGVTVQVAGSQASAVGFAVDGTCPLAFVGQSELQSQTDSGRVRGVVDDVDPSRSVNPGNADVRVVWESEKILPLGVVLSDSLPDDLRLAIVEVLTTKANQSWATSNGFCVDADDTCLITTDLGWGFAPVTAGDYEGYRALCSPPMSALCRP